MKIMKEIACNLQIQFENNSNLWLNWIELNSNSIEEKWGEIWCKMYWKSSHDYGVENETLRILITIN
jgi:hypothetical protein